MDPCDAIQRYVARLCDGEEVGSERDFYAHLAECEDCRHELRRVNRTAAYVILHTFEDIDTDSHIGELDLAVFAAHGLDAPNSDAVVQHLSRCRECREQFRHIRRFLEQHDALFPMEGAFADSLSGGTRTMFSDVRRLARAIGSFVSWVAEWAVLLIVLFQIAAAYLANPNQIGRSPATEFLGVVPRDELRLWLIAATCIALAFLFRWLGARLFRNAVEPDARV